MPSPNGQQRSHNGLSQGRVGTLPPHPVLIHPLVPDAKIPGTNRIRGSGYIVDSLIVITTVESFTVGETHIGTSTLVPVKQEPALTCLNSTRRAR